MTDDSFTAVVTARDTKVLIAEFTGRIDSLAVHAGQRVKAGQLIAKLDTSDLEAEVAQLGASEKSERASAGAASATAQSDCAKAQAEQRLRNVGVGSRVGVITALSACRASGAQAGAASQRGESYAVQKQRIQELLPKADIKSPIDGVLVTVSAKPGEMAQKGTPIARVYDPSDLIIRFAVPDEQRPLIELGQPVQLTIAGVDHPIWATIEEINAELTPPTTIHVVVADLDDSKLTDAGVRIAAQGKVHLVKPRAPAPRVL